MFQKGYQKIKSRKAQSLLELIIAIVIIGIIVGIVMSDAGTSVSDSKTVRVKADMQTIYSAGQKYYADMGSYPVGTVSSNGTQGAVCTTLMAQATNSSGETKGPWLAKCPYSPYTGGSYTTSGTTNTTFNVSHSSTGKEFNKDFKSIK